MTLHEIFEQLKALARQADNGGYYSISLYIADIMKNPTLPYLTYEDLSAAYEQGLIHGQRIAGKDLLVSALSTPKDANFVSQERVCVDEILSGESNQEIDQAKALENQNDALEAPLPNAKELTLQELVSGDYPFVVLDTETTGLGATAEICQIAIIDHVGKRIMDTLIKPKNPISADASRIHGITNEMVKDAPTFPELHRTLVQILTDENVVVYNATFDRGMLHKSAEAWGMPKTEWKELATWHCAMLAFAEIYGEWNAYHGNYKWQKLSTAATYYGIQVKDAHTALGDCKMTLEVLRKMYPYQDGE